VTGNNTKRAYLGLLGHFRDPIRFLANPVGVARGKASTPVRILADAWNGQDWKNRDFTSVSELASLHKLTKFDARGRHGLTWSKMPSFVATELGGVMPIGLQNLVQFTGGEMEAWDTFLKTAGVLSSTVKEPQ
jgi:hypothetical protein